jgi:hypothetical protein
MARVYYDRGTPFGAQVGAAIQQIKAAQNAWGRVRSMMDEISSFSSNTAALEGSKEFGVAEGQGAAFYNAVTGVQAALFTNSDFSKPVQATVDLDLG